MVFDKDNVLRKWYIKIVETLCMHNLYRFYNK